MARPTKYEDVRADKICGLLRAGCTRKASAESSGITYQTFLRWLETNVSFVTSVSRAEADAENIMAAVIQKAATKGDDWRAAESWLKRRRRDEWGDALNLTNKSDYDLLSAAAEIFKRAGQGDPGGSDPARPGAGPEG